MSCSAPRLHQMRYRCSTRRCVLRAQTFTLRGLRSHPDRLDYQRPAL